MYSKQEKFIKSKYTRLNIAQKLEIIEYKDKNQNSSAETLANIFSARFKQNIKVRTIYNVLNTKEKIRDQSVFTSNTTKSIPFLRFPELDKRLKNYLDAVDSKNGIINDSIIHKKIKEFAVQLNVKEFKNSKGWLQKFKKRNSFQLKKLYGETCEVNETDLLPFLKVFQEKSKIYSLDHIYNMDETGLFYKLIPSKTVTKKIRKGHKLIKDRFSVSLCSNFTGSHKCKPLIIGKFAKPRCFKDFDLDKHVCYENSARAWMTSDIFKKWLRKLNADFKKTDKKILLLLDNCPAHTIGDMFCSHIELLFLPKNTTGILQPMDRGIIKNFKAAFNNYKMSNIIEKMEDCDKTVFEAYKSINLKDAIIFTVLAWESVKNDTIYNCFKHLIKGENYNNIETTDVHPTVVDNFIKDAKIPDPLDKEEFLEIKYNENDAIMSELEEKKDLVDEVSLEEYENETIIKNEDEDGNITYDQFLDCVKKIKKYVNQSKNMTESIYQLRKDLEKYNNSKRKEEKNEKGLLYFFNKKN